MIEFGSIWKLRNGSTGVESVLFWEFYTWCGDADK